MNVEIVEFYPFTKTKDFLDGSIKIKINVPGCAINCLGIYVKKEKSSWYFRLPRRKSSHHETGKVISFPYFAFEDKMIQKAFMAQLKEKAQKYIENRISSDTLLPTNEKFRPPKKEFKKKPFKKKMYVKKPAK